VTPPDPPDPGTTRVDVAALAGGQRLRFEWSMRLERGRLSVRDKSIVWLLRWDDTSPLDLAGVRRLLSDSSCPPRVRGVVDEHGPDARTVGVGLDARDARAVALYVERRGAHAGRCAAYRWEGEAGEVEQVRYSPWFLPASPHGERPEALVHPDLRGACLALLGLERVKRTSTFWLRRRGEGIDQVSITMGWSPSLAALHEVLREHLDAPWTPAWSAASDHRVRHVAFSGRGARAHVTFYLAGDVPGDRARTLEELRACALDDARFMAELWEETFSRRLTAIATPGRRPRAAERPHEDDWRGLVRHVPAGSTVYVMGFEDEVVLTHLRTHRGCEVLGVMGSWETYVRAHQAGERVRWGEPEGTWPPFVFDVIVWNVRLCELEDPEAMLRNACVCCGRLVVSMRGRLGRGLPSRPDVSTFDHDDLHALLLTLGWSIDVWQVRLTPEGRRDVEVVATHGLAGR
jgi:hypothetical protein